MFTYDQYFLCGLGEPLSCRILINRCVIVGLWDPGKIDFTS